MSRLLTLVSLLVALALPTVAEASERACPLHAGKATASRSLPLDDVERLLAGSCDCKDPGACTCKKGECACKGCGEAPRRMFDMLRDGAKLPVPDARHDATAGVFI